MLSIEFSKIKRSWIVPLLFIAPILVVATGVASLSRYLTPEYTSAWPAMFIQSALVYSYYLLPLSMIIVCVMISARETQNNGILKMLALPVSRQKMSLCKFAVIVFFLLMEILVFFVAFVIAGIIATKTNNVEEALPLGYLLSCCAKLFITMLPATAFMWAITVLFEKPLLSIGLNLLLVIPGVLVANTSAWLCYPYCYSGYLVTCSLYKYTTEANTSVFQPFPFAIYATVLFILALTISVVRFGKKEMS
ncbi:MAG: ABC transporter permease [Pseudobutyrivibrio sp.]|nr:ABC transporter permease [Pseudobutyrivibrio sp.]